MPHNASDFDAVVIGAGAAGLSAAYELATNGCRVWVIEARERLGGRIYTRREPDVPVPLELGAEFVHGESIATLDWLKRANEPVVDATQTRWIPRGNKLESADEIFDELKSALARIRRPKRDIPFDTFLEDFARRRLTPALRAFARMLVEGFDAADSTRVSTHEILDEWTGDAAADAPTFRPFNGYAALVEAIAAALPKDRVRVQTNWVVHRVQWRRGEVIVSGTCFDKPFTITSPRCIVTLPLGVLQRPPDAPNGVQFTPSLPGTDALSMLASGPVIKLILRFHEPFWEKLDNGRYRGAAFFQAPGQVFPTFWTSLPARSSQIVAWTAGPNITRLAGYDSARIVSAAIESLQSIFGRRISVEEQLAGAHMHDWQADPFACGAYSYVLAGGSDARKRIARPIQNTLYLAGEAFDLEGGSGTVGGALQSGRRAAQLALRHLEKNKKKISRKARQDRKGQKR